MARIWIALKMMGLMTLLTGMLYPLFITLIGTTFFNRQVNGSLVMSGGRIVGSELLAQGFDSSTCFSSRPSAVNYNTMSSGGSNLGLSSRSLAKQEEENSNRFREMNKLPGIPVPAEMVCSSASGLDPDISPESAILQAGRICRSRGYNLSQRNQLMKKIEELERSPQFHLLGEKRINVLLLNLELEKIR